MLHDVLMNLAFIRVHPPTPHPHLQGLLSPPGHTWTVRPGSSTWWWCKWRTCWASVVVTPPPPQSPSAWLMSTTMDPYSSIVSHLYSMTHTDANTRPCTLSGGMREVVWDKALQTVRRCLILYLRGIYLIMLPQFRWVVCAASAAFGCTRLRTVKIKSRQLKKRERKGNGRARGWACSLHLRVHTYICRPLLEFNHSHMKGHLSWPFETNLGFSAINLTKWMPREEINSIKMKRRGRYFNF